MTNQLPSDHLKISLDTRLPIQLETAVSILNTLARSLRSVPQIGPEARVEIIEVQQGSWWVQLLIIGGGLGAVITGAQALVEEIKAGRTPFSQALSAAMDEGVAERCTISTSDNSVEITKNEMGATPQQAFAGKNPEAAAAEQYLEQPPFADNDEASLSAEEATSSEEGSGFRDEYPADTNGRSYDTGQVSSDEEDHGWTQIRGQFVSAYDGRYRLFRHNSREYRLAGQDEVLNAIPQDTEIVVHARNTPADELILTNWRLPDEKQWRRPIAKIHATGEVTDISGYLDKDSPRWQIINRDLRLEVGNFNPEREPPARRISIFTIQAVSAPPVDLGVDSVVDVFAWSATDAEAVSLTGRIVTRHGGRFAHFKSNGIEYRVTWPEDLVVQIPIGDLIKITGIAGAGPLPTLDIWDWSPVDEQAPDDHHGHARKFWSETSNDDGHIEEVRLREVFGELSGNEFFAVGHIRSGDGFAYFDADDGQGYRIENAEAVRKVRSGEVAAVLEQRGTPLDDGPPRVWLVQFQTAPWNIEAASSSG